jgi:SOS-response transcriptional repressor LexA
MDNGIIERIEERLKVVGLSAAAASVAAGLSPDAIRNMQRSAKKGRANMTVETLQSLAPVLQTSIGWLLSEDGDSGTDVSEVRPYRPRLIPVPVVGRAAAGHFYEADEFDQSDLEKLFLPPDERFPRARQIAFEVDGDSMNDLKPKPLYPGDKAICVAYEDIADVMPIIQGMVVVVQRSRDGGHTREWSVKQVELQAGKTVFQPRSTNPRHKPIVVDRDMTADDGVQVEVIALVRRIISDLPLS